MVDLTQFPLSKTGLAVARGQSQLANTNVGGAAAASLPKTYVMSNSWTNANALTIADLRTKAGAPATAVLMALSIRGVEVAGVPTFALAAGSQPIVAGEVIELPYTGNPINTTGLAITTFADDTIRVAATFV